MQLTYSNGFFIAVCSFDERHIPKANKFKWSVKKRIWYTEKPEIAYRLKQYCDDAALHQISRVLLTVKPFEKPLEVPAGLSLFPYQEKAILFALERNRSYLGLDPGLGKTICAAVIANTMEAHVYYVCPPFLVETVKEEFSKWHPQIFPYVVPDSQLEKFIPAKPWIGKSNILFIDEAHRFKNETAKRTETLFNEIFPKFEKVVFLSGTPMPNRPMELYTVLSKAAPECIEFRNRWEYGMRYCAGFKNQWGWDFSGASNLKELQSRVINTFMCRMKKAEVMAELPPKTNNMVVIEKELSAKIMKLEGPILKACSPHDLMKNEVPSDHIATYRRELGFAKIDPALDFIKDILEETEESILVFAIHKDVIAGLNAGLDKYKPLVVTGDTKMDDRHDFVKKFQAKESRVFLGNIQAAGTGFTLTAATRVIFVEFPWDPGSIDQASDRAHRIGQKDNVLVHFLIYRNSLDRAVLETILYKRKVTAYV